MQPAARYRPLQLFVDEDTGTVVTPVRGEWRVVAPSAGAAWLPTTGDEYILTSDGSGGVRSVAAATVDSSGNLAAVALSAIGQATIGTGSTDHVNIAGGTGGATVSVAGASTNANLLLTPKGAGVVAVGANQGTYVIMGGSGSLTASITAFGQPTNDLQLVGWGGAVLFCVDNTDYLRAVGGTGTAQLQATGGSSNVDLSLAAKGTGAVRLDALKTDHVTVSGGTGTATLTAVGASTDIHLALAAKGTGGILLDSAKTDHVGVSGATGSVAVTARGASADVDFTISPKGSGIFTAAGVVCRGGIVTTPVYYDFGGSTQSVSFVSSGHASTGSDPTPVLAHANFSVNRLQISSLPGDISLGSSGTGVRWSPSSTRRWTVDGGSTVSYEYHIELAIARGTGATPGMLMAQVDNLGTSTVRFRYVQPADVDYLIASGGMHGTLTPGESLAIAVWGTSIHTISWDVQFRAIGFTY